ncbi:1,4-alpha-glucan branching enzyme [Sinobaca qinghaiensis]|uniref:1,4-alpha-glucan branching enzyme GlgB n=1 Tax=Sinobaca qinghaiensis TaxID=342944 RepID=A0A419V3T4_9BACL|nr:1,4-alpha-glucan branching protein GlgB [Sinobaca qinghaiensis]RKD73177.1 1,4-alpha-glucan branching enzyme [Sinobaca qinghaiensis]
MDMYGITEEQLYLFHEGTFYHSHHVFGCHHITYKGKKGCRFTVWAPHAEKIHIACEENAWTGEGFELHRIDDLGVWSGFFPEWKAQATYKYSITAEDGSILLKADPYAVFSEIRPNTASVSMLESTHHWNDEKYLAERARTNFYESKIAVYEMHAGTWKQHPDGSFYSYRELATHIIPYLLEMEYTHVELLPISEHPFDQSWGYQVTGYFSITSRYGTPDDFKYFVDACHASGIGVIMDWVPGHFCKDSHGLRQFDGKPLYEYDDPMIAEKTNWGTLVFDYTKPEVRSFLISNAVFWLEDLHLDGIRVDAVASMIYYNLEKTEMDAKVYNIHGEGINLEAVDFLKQLNTAVSDRLPDTLMIAEESTAWPMITHPVKDGGLGFDFKWNMGWMNDTLTYMKMHWTQRKDFHHLLTFSGVYAFSERFILPLSHDEVVHEKKSLLDKMPGSQEEQFSQLRLLYGYMASHPGKTLLFMGGEIGAYDEWRDKEELAWNLLTYPIHHALQRYVASLQKFVKNHPALYAQDHQPEGFTWVDADNSEQNILLFTRQSEEEELLILCNFSGMKFPHFRIGVSEPGLYQEVFNSDEAEFGGSGYTNRLYLPSSPSPLHGRPHSIDTVVPPFSTLYFKKRKAIKRRNHNG